MVLPGPDFDGDALQVRVPEHALVDRLIVRLLVVLAPPFAGFVTARFVFELPLLAAGRRCPDLIDIVVDDLSDRLRHRGLIAPPRSFPARALTPPDTEVLGLLRRLRWRHRELLLADD